MIAGPATGKSELVFGDAHVRATERPDLFERFSALGRLALKARPDTIRCLGDLGDFASLAEYLGSRATGGAGSKKAHQGLRLKDDIDAFSAALKAIKEPIDTYNRAQRRAGRSAQQYLPHFIFHEGNHEERLDRVGQHIPELHGLIGTNMLRKTVVAQGWLYVPFLEVHTQNGVSFAHYFESGSLKKAVQPKQALNHLNRSAVWGHQHKFAFDSKMAVDQTWIKVVCIPCYKPLETLSPFEDSGVVFLNNIENGNFEISQVGMREIMARFGSQTQKRSAA